MGECRKNYVVLPSPGEKFCTETEFGDKSVPLGEFLGNLRYYKIAEGKE